MMSTQRRRGGRVSGNAEVRERLRGKAEKGEGEVQKIGKFVDMINGNPLK